MILGFTWGEISDAFAALAVAACIIAAVWDHIADKRESQDLISPRDPSKIGR